MEAIINQNVANMNKVVTAKDVAKACGVSAKTVYNIVEGKHNAITKRSKATQERVLAYVEQVGYDPKVAMKSALAQNGSKSTWSENARIRGLEVRRTNSTSGNFVTRQEETDRMLYLRKEKAMTNPEIAKKIGVSYQTVRRRIGNQPKELTEMSFALYGERKSSRNQARHEVLLKQKIAQFEKYRQEVETINAHAAELEAQAQRIADEAKAIREQYSSKVVELNAYRKEAEKAAKELGRSLA